jgi:hypothetical protein
MKRVATPIPERRPLAGLRERVSAGSGALRILTALALLAWAPTLLAQGTLENPAHMGYESGIGIVSGWHCDATQIEVQFDAYPPIEAAYGTSREDTAGPCGDADNGFGLLWNWSILGAGQHTVRVFADGAEFDSATIEVNTIGAEFEPFLSMSTALTWLEIDKEIELRWQTNRQNFVITHVEDAEFTMGDIIALLEGAWSGNWNAPGASGALSMTIGDDGAGQVAVADVNLTGTGCAAHGVGSGASIDINDPLIEVVLDDGSMVEFDILVTESFSGLGGTLWFASGPCADTDGIYYLFRD